jgi:hypothetical protein
MGTVEVILIGEIILIMVIGTNKKLVMLVGIVGYLLLKKIVPLEDMTRKEVIGNGMMITVVENG